MLYGLAMAMGIVAGLRAMTAPAAVSWAGVLGAIDLSASPLAFLGWRYTPWILTLLALGELITDKLPATPSRKVPIQFGARIVSGLLSGGAIGASGGQLAAGAALGAAGAVIGTLGGAGLRARLAAALGRDRPAAVIEDVCAVGAAALMVAAL